MPTRYCLCALDQFICHIIYFDDFHLQSNEDICFKHGIFWLTSLQFSSIELSLTKLLLLLESLLSPFSEMVSFIFTDWLKSDMPGYQMVKVLDLLDKSLPIVCLYSSRKASRLSSHVGSHLISTFNRKVKHFDFDSNNHQRSSPTQGTSLTIIPKIMNP